jgi:hypothetical protein
MSMVGWICYPRGGRRSVSDCAGYDSSCCDFCFDVFNLVLRNIDRPDDSAPTTSGPWYSSTDSVALLGKHPLTRIRVEKQMPVMPPRPSFRRQNR